jgi:hypothetical protein
LGMLPQRIKFNTEPLLKRKFNRVHSETCGMVTMSFSRTPVQAAPDPSVALSTVPPYVHPEEAQSRMPDVSDTSELEVSSTVATQGGWTCSPGTVAQPSRQGITVSPGSAHYTLRSDHSPAAPSAAGRLTAYRPVVTRAASVRQRSGRRRTYGQSLWSSHVQRTAWSLHTAGPQALVSSATPQM